MVDSGLITVCSIRLNFPWWSIRLLQTSIYAMSLHLHLSNHPSAVVTCFTWGTILLSHTNGRNMIVCGTEKKEFCIDSHISGRKIRFRENEVQLSVAFFFFLVVLHLTQIQFPNNCFFIHHLENTIPYFAVKVPFPTYTWQEWGYRDVLISIMDHSTMAVMNPIALHSNMPRKLPTAPRDSNDVTCVPSSSSSVREEADSSLAYAELNCLSTVVRTPQGQVFVRQCLIPGSMRTLLLLVPCVAAHWQRWRFELVVLIRDCTVASSRSLSSFVYLLQCFLGGDDWDPKGFAAVVPDVITSKFL